MRRRLAVALLALALTTCATPAQAFWAAQPTNAGPARATATTVNAGSTPTTSVSGSSVTVSWSTGTLANGQPVTGYVVKRYSATSVSQVVGAGCSGTLTATTCTETSLPDGKWRYTVTPLFGTTWRGVESPMSSVATVDTVAPANNLSLSSVTGGASLSGGTLYYRGAAAGSFALTNTVTDATSGAASSATTALSGTTTGWTHSPSTVSAPTGGPFVSAPFSWAASTSASPGETVTGRDNVGNTTASSLTLVDDSTAPPTGTLSYVDGYTLSSVSVSFTAGAADTGSGVTSRQLQRASAPLDLGTGACGTYGSYTNVATTNPASPYVDTTVANQTCDTYRYAATDKVGNVSYTTSTSVAKVADYAVAVKSTAGLVSYWRLGEDRTPTTVSADSFTGTAGATLQSRTGETGASWTLMTASTYSDADAVLMSNGRIRKANSATNTATRSAIYYSSGLPSSADYAVSADVTLMSSVANDDIGVLGRASTSVATFYAAVWDATGGAGGTGRWGLYGVVNGTVTPLASSTSQPLAAGGTANLRLDMDGPTIRVLVNGVQVISVQDVSVTAAGRGGVVIGGNINGLATLLSDTTGLQLDNFSMITGAAGAVDAKGSSTGTYLNGAARASAGALALDPNTSSLFDGVDDAMQVRSPAGLPTGAAGRSVELWLRTTSTSRQVLFDYGSEAGAGQEFGLWLDAGASTLTAWGYGASYDKTFTPPSTLADGAWHHVVETYDGAVVTVFVDGVGLPSQAVTLGTVLDSYGFTLGAVLNPGDAASAGGPFNGTLDDVSLYNVALAPATVTNHYQLGTAH